MISSSIAWRTARRRRPGALGVVARHRYAQHSAGTLDLVAITYDDVDDFEAPLGSVWVFNSSLVRRVTTSAVSSWRIRLRTAATAAIVTPGRSPRSTRSWSRQF